MSASIFLIDHNETLIELTRSAYASEDLFQDLLGKHPRLLTITAGESGRLLLIRREQEVPDTQNGGGRWSLDHLFLDGSGVPVLVEVKRASDTRARREVVAQMLDYAANGVAYWPIENIIAAHDRTCGELGIDPDQNLQAFIGSEDADAFWQQVEANLKSGRIRMVFVADMIAPELRRIVEFLNEQMRPAEVLAVEVEQFLDPNGFRTLVPKLVGETARAQAVKNPKGSSHPLPPITVEEWINRFAERHGHDARRSIDQLVGWFRANGIEVSIPASQASLSAGVRRTASDGRLANFVFVYLKDGYMQLPMPKLPLGSEETRLAVVEEYSAIPGAELSSNLANGLHGMPLAALSSPETWNGLTRFYLKLKGLLE